MPLTLPQIADASGCFASDANASPERASGASSSATQNDSSEPAHPSTSASTAPLPDSTATVVAPLNSNLPDVSTATPLVVPSVVVSATSPAAQAAERLKMGPRSGNDDDVYEFREPEPFAFEVRARRESPFSEDRVANRLTPRKSAGEEDAENNKKATPPVFQFFYYCLLKIIYSHF